MSLADDIENDAAAFLNEDDFATPATYKPLGAGSGTACSVVFAESEQAILEFREGESRSREASVAAPAATVTDPQRKDTYTVASGPLAGTWVCTHVENRDAGIVTVRCRLETKANTVAENAHEVRP